MPFDPGGEAVVRSARFSASGGAGPPTARRAEARTTNPQGSGNALPRTRRGLRSAAGQALVEFALLTPLLLLIISGIVEAGRAFYAYVQIANAVREGVRAGSFIPTETSQVDALTRRELPPWIATNIVNVTVDCAEPASDAFGDCVTQYPPTSRYKMKVTASYNYRPIMPVINDITTIMAVTMTASAVMQVQ